ncbi:MAG: ATP-binding protein [Eubacteriales bacterium]|nr:ATP-binding protein [Eubacteriales bacterium]
MAYDGRILAKARIELENIRNANREEMTRRTERVYYRVPRIAQIDRRMREQMTQIVKMTIARRPDIKAQIAVLEKENLNLQAEKAELLVENGFPTDYLEEIVCCEKCRDTGIFEDGVCECLDRIYNKELTKELGTLMRRGDESFERFDLSLYPDTFDPTGNIVPREVMSKVLDRCRRYAENFPNVSSDLLMQGDTGLGKTYLSACIARVVADKGFSVCYDSAFTALEYFEKQKFSRDIDEAAAADNRVKRMLDCDLMILDDLGTEMATPMAVSALYNLINTRLVNGRRMIISTNLRDDELAKRYTPQIASRILGEFVHLPFAGNDIRMIRR